MEYSIERRDELVVIHVQGRVDEASWEAFGTGLSEAIGQARGAGLERVIIDLGGLEYMSSRGLRALTVAKREGEAAGVTLSLAAPNEVMREILAISRYDKLFAVTDAIESGR
ncbi:MAG TPA: STAS domain-containing protein [Sphingomicrobium sp.]|nr:STAS domain-containing protein [Sphingomicrobium sp.]